MAFEPTDFSDLMLWLDATNPDTVTVNGTGQISQIDDLSANGNHATQTTASRQPDYDEGKGRIVFPFDSARHLNLATGVTPDRGAVTMFVVGGVQNLRNDKFRTLIDFTLSGSNKLGLFVGQNGTLGIFNGTSVVNADETSMTTGTGVFSLRSNGTTVKLRENGHEESLSESLSGATQSGGLGAPQNNSNPFAGFIKEVIIYDKALTDAEIDRVELYLRTKHGTNVTTNRVVCIGDSLMNGFKGGQDLKGVPFLLGDKLTGAGAGVYTSAKNGRSISDMSAAKSTEIDPLFKTGETNLAIVWAGLQDLGNASGNQAIATHSALDTFCSALQSDGWLVAVVTIPEVTVTGNIAAGEVDDYNELIRNNFTDYANILIDVAADIETLTDPEDYLAADGNNLTADGYATVADAIAQVIVD